MGALQDFVNSAIRYLKNNYFDGTRQVCVVGKKQTMPYIVIPIGRL